MKKLILIMLSTAALGEPIPGPVHMRGDDKPSCVECCQPKKCPKAKVVTKTVVKEVPVIVEKTVIKEVERIVEKEPKKNTLSLVVGGGIDRTNTAVFGARYSRDISDIQVGIEGLSNYNRLRNLNTIMETGTVSLGVKF